MDILRQSLAIGVVFALLWLALWLLRKRNGTQVGFLSKRAGRGPLESLGRLPLSPQHSVHVVRAGGRELIVGVHPRGITLLGETEGASSRPTQGLE